MSSSREMVAAPVSMALHLSLSFVQQATRLFITSHQRLSASGVCQSVQTIRRSCPQNRNISCPPRRGLQRNALLWHLDPDSGERGALVVSLSSERQGAGTGAGTGEHGGATATESANNSKCARGVPPQSVLFRQVLRHDGWKELAAVAELRTLVFSPYAADPWFFARRKEELYNCMRSRLEINPGRNHTFVLVPRDPNAWTDAGADLPAKGIIGTADVTEYPNPCEDDGLWFGPGYLFPFLLSADRTKTRRVAKESTAGEALEETRKPGSVYISGLAIAPGFRGRGLGRFVLWEIERWTQRRYCEAMYLHVERHNVAGVRLYETFGFRPVQEREIAQLWKKRTGEREHLLMCKPLELVTS